MDVHQDSQRGRDGWDRQKLGVAALATPNDWLERGAVSRLVPLLQGDKREAMRTELFRPTLGEAELAAVQSVFASGWIGYGPRCEEVERRWSAEVGSGFGVALNSCTSALIIALRLRDVGPGDEVIVPTITFAATAEAVLSVGATPVFCDIEPATMLMDVTDAQARITPKTAAVIPVLYAGQPFDVGDAFGSLPVVYDCAHAAGSAFNARNKTCCWSFQAVKNLGCGDGGMLTVPSRTDQARAKRLAWHGIDRSTWDRSQAHRYSWEYDITEQGYKAQMTDITAAILSVQIERLGDLRYLRRNVAYEYYRQLRRTPVICDPADMRSHGWHLFVMKSDRRDDLATHLNRYGIVTGVHYRPLHLHSLYRLSDPLPNAEREWKRVLSLPMYPQLSTRQIDLICDHVNEFEERT